MSKVEKYIYEVSCQAAEERILKIKEEAALLELQAARAAAAEQAKQGVQNAEVVEGNGSKPEAPNRGDDQNAQLDEIASGLEGRSYQLFQALRKRKNFVYLKTLNDEVYAKPVKDKSVKTALERLSVELADTGWTIRFDNGRAKLTII